MVIEEKPENESEGAALDAVDALKEPPKYAVVLHNDNYTTMEFVVEVLQKFFGKTRDQAVQVMLKVHQDGKGIAGIYSFDIAEFLES